MLVEAMPGSGLTRERARRVLEAGFAGEPVVTSSAKLYDAATVTSLAARPVVTEQELIERFPLGILVARRQIDVRTTDAEQRSALSRDWDISTMLAMGLVGALHAVRGGDPDGDEALPLVATVCGFVATGAEVTSFRFGGAGGDVLELRPPGQWFDDLRHTRIRTGPGAPWWLSSWSMRGHWNRRLPPAPMLPLQQ